MAFKVITRVYSRLCPSFPRDYQMPDLLMSQAKHLISHGVKKITWIMQSVERMMDLDVDSGHRSVRVVGSR